MLIQPTSAFEEHLIVTRLWQHRDVILVAALHFHLQSATEFSHTVGSPVSLVALFWVGWVSRDCHLRLFHLASAALRAISDRCSGVSSFALAGPPFLPPLLPIRLAAAECLRCVSTSGIGGRDFILLRVGPTRTKIKKIS